MNGREPNVILDVRFERGLLFMSIKNIGDEPAFGVSVEFDKPIRGVAGRRIISELPLFKKIEFLAPAKEIETFVDTSGAYFARGEPRRLTAKISYRDSLGEHHRNTITHNLQIYEDLVYVRVSPTAETEGKELGQIEYRRVLGEGAEDG